MRRRNYNKIYEVYDDNNNLIYYKDSSIKYEVWYQYDEFGNCIHTIDSEGHESWNKYDECGNPINYMNNDIYI